MGALCRKFTPFFGLAFALMLAVGLWDFTVDDALISCRYAFHIAQGHGARFNVAEGPTDGVTPLIWPWVIAPLASAGPMKAYVAAKVLGLACWGAAALILAGELKRIGCGLGLRRNLPGWIAAFGTPAVAAWSVAGMETGPAILLCTLSAVSSRRPRLGSVLAGLVALLRPEMVAWASVIAAGHAMTPPEQSKPRVLSRSVAFSGLAAIVPFATVCAVRWGVFGSVAPLALRAKPSDLSHGMVYAAATLIVAGPPLAALAPAMWRHLPRWPRWVLLAFGVHTLVVIAVGGDWMPLSRLFVPALPSLAVVVAHIARTASLPSTILQAVLCAAGQLFVLIRVGPDAARVGRDRVRLIAQLAPLLAPQDTVAALDVGWVGVAFDGKIVDLAGLTDPSIASLRGGHTSKAIPPMLLAEKGVTKFVLLLPPEAGLQEAWGEGRFSRAVESRLGQMAWVRERYEPLAVLASTPKFRYALVVRKAE